MGVVLGSSAPCVDGMHQGSRGYLGIQHGNGFPANLMETGHVGICH